VLGKCASNTGCVYVRQICTAQWSRSQNLKENRFSDYSSTIRPLSTAAVWMYSCTKNVRVGILVHSPSFFHYFSFTNAVLIVQIACGISWSVLCGEFLVTDTDLQWPTVNSSDRYWPIVTYSDQWWPTVNSKPTCAVVKTGGLKQMCFSNYLTVLQNFLCLTYRRFPYFPKLQLYFTSCTKNCSANWLTAQKLETFTKESSIWPPSVPAEVAAEICRSEIFAANSCITKN